MCIYFWWPQFLWRNFSHTILFNIMHNHNQPFNICYNIFPFFKTLHHLAAIQKKIWCGLGQINGLHCRLKLSCWPSVLRCGGCLVEVRRLYHWYVRYTTNVCQSGHPIYNQHRETFPFTTLGRECSQKFLNEQTAKDLKLWSMPKMSIFHIVDIQ